MESDALAKNHEIQKILCFKHTCRYLKLSRRSREGQVDRMEKRRELKRRAREGLRSDYWKVFLASLLVFILGGSSGGGDGLSVISRVMDVWNKVQQKIAHGEIPQRASEFLGGSLLNRRVVLMFTLVLLVAFTTALASVLWGILVGNPMQVGCCRYFLERKMGIQPGIGRVFLAFQGGHYFNGMKVMLLRSLSVFLWGLLLIVPGIVKSYEYAMIPYLLAEEPLMKWKEAAEKSRILMNGHKMELFILEYSFVGWYLLGACLCGIGMFFVLPYEYATVMEFYAELQRVHPCQKKSQMVY